MTLQLQNIFSCERIRGFKVDSYSFIYNFKFIQVINAFIKFAIISKSSFYIIYFAMTKTSKNLIAYF